MARNTTAMKRGFNYDKVNGRMSIMVDGVEAIHLTKSSTGCDIRLLGDTPASNYIDFDASGPTLSFVGSLSSQTTENNIQTLSLTTDSSYLTGTNLTYSSARGSASLKVSGIYSGTGGFSAIYANVTTSGAQTTDGHGVIGVKCVVTNTATITDGEVFGAQFIAKHNHATSDMGKSASLIGLESWAYISNTGTVGTLLGANVGYHNECTTTQETGSVHRALQVFCDDASGAANATESTGIEIWNMAGIQDAAIRVTESGSGFTNLFNFDDVSVCVLEDSKTAPDKAGSIVIVMPSGNTAYINVYDGTRAT